MPVASNDAELTALLTNSFEDIINRVADRVIEEIVKPSVDENVYQAYLPRMYNRQGGMGGFLGAWEQETVSDGTGSIKTEIGVNPLSMVLDEEHYIHGSDLHGDVRSMLAEYIMSGLRYDFDFNMPRDFWTPIQTAINNGGIDKIIEAEMTKKGINWTKN